MTTSILMKTQTWRCTSTNLFLCQVIFKVPSSNDFLTSQKILDLKKIVLDVPKGVKLAKLTRNYRKFCPLARLANISNCNLFMHPVYMLILLFTITYDYNFTNCYG